MFFTTILNLNPSSIQPVISFLSYVLSSAVHASWHALPVLVVTLPVLVVRSRLLPFLKRVLFPMSLQHGTFYFVSRGR